MKKYLLYIVIFFIGALAGMWAHRQYHFRDEEKKVQIDTLWRFDTTVIEKPVLVERTIKDSLLVAVHDTIMVKDTVFIALPMERKTYKGEEYYAEVSGYKPSLDRIEVYSKTETIYQTIIPKERKHSVSLYGSIGYMNEVRLPVGLEYQYSMSKWLSVGAKVEHDFALNATVVYGIAEITIGW